MRPPVGEGRARGLLSPRRHDRQGRAFCVDDLVCVEKLTSACVEFESKHLVIAAHEQVLCCGLALGLRARTPGSRVVSHTCRNAAFVNQPDARHLLCGERAAVDKLANPLGANAEHSTCFGNSDAEHATSKTLVLNKVIMKK